MIFIILNNNLDVNKKLIKSGTSDQLKFDFI